MLSLQFLLTHLSLSLYLSISLYLLSPTRSTDYTSLIFKGCANQNLQDQTSLQNLNNLMDSLVSQSSQKTFATVVSGDTQFAISGLYQCRGDLSVSQCYSCVKKIPEMAEKLCGKVVAARVHLNGCYLKYEVAGFKQVPDTQLLYKVCRSDKASGTSGSDQKREAAFDLLVNGVKNSLFYTGNYQSLFVLGQCEGDLSNGDCGDCIKTAIESEKSECGDSISGHIYLYKCYVSFSYYPNGVPGISTVSGVGTTKHHTQRTVAIAVGGVAALGFLIVCLLCVKSHLKRQKRISKYEMWG